jgi:hypothetical protein
LDEESGRRVEAADDSTESDSGQSSAPVDDDERGVGPAFDATWAQEAYSAGGGPKLALDCARRMLGAIDDWAVMAPRSRPGLAQTLLPYALAVLHVRSMHPSAMASFAEVRVALVQAARDAGLPVGGSLAWQDANLHVPPLLLSLFGKPGAPGQMQRWLGRHGLNPAPGGGASIAMNHARYVQLVEELCATIGVPDAKHVLETGTVSCEGFSIKLEHVDTDPEAMYLEFDFGITTAGRTLRIFRLMLESNLLVYAQDQAQLALNPDTGGALLILRVPMTDDIDGPWLADTFIHYAEHGRYWRDNMSSSEEEMFEGIANGDYVWLRA